MANTFTDSPIMRASDENRRVAGCPSEGCSSPGCTLCVEMIDSDAELLSDGEISSSDSIAEEEYVLVDPFTDSDVESCSDGMSFSSDSLAGDEGVLEDPSADSDTGHHSDCNSPADPFPNSSVLWPGLETLFSDSIADSDCDEILFTNPKKVATSTVEEPRVRPPFRRTLCTSRFCGAVGIKHSVGPYVHRGVFPHSNPRERGLPSPPWGKAYPPKQVWDAWYQLLPTGVGPERDNTLTNRTPKKQRQIDLVDGFIAHHSWFPDEKIFHPAETFVFKKWCEDWKKQRELGFLFPQIEEVYW